MPTSNETLVLVDDFVNIIAIVLPLREILAMPALCSSFNFFVILKILSISAADRSKMLIRCFILHYLHG